MAQFGIEATKMSPADTSGASFIKQGVQDTSGALAIQATTGLIGNVGTKVVEAYHGYNLAGYETEIDKVNKEVMERQNPKTIFPQGMATSDPKFNETLDRYTNALKQGRMGEDEYLTATKVVLKDAVAKNPGMMDEYISHAKKYMSVVGMEDITKQNDRDIQALAKSQEYLQHKDIEMGEKLNTLQLARTPEGGVNFPRLRQLNAGRMNEEALIKGYENKDKITEQEARLAFPTVANSLLNRGLDTVTQIMNDPSMPVDKALAQARLVLSSIPMSILKDPRASQLLDKPFFQATIKNIEDQIKTFDSTITKYATKEDIAKYSSNLRNMQADADYMQASKLVNPNMLDAFQKVASAIGPAAWDDVQLKTDAFNTMAFLLRGIKTSNPDMYKAGVTGKDPLASQVVDTLAKEKDASPSIIESLGNAIKAIVEDISDLPTNQKFLFNDDFMKRLGKPENKENINKISEDTRYVLNQNITEHANTITSELNSVLQQLNKESIVVSKTVLPDGRIYINTENPHVLKELNSKYIFRLNDTMKAYSNVHGFPSQKTGSDKFFESYPINLEEKTPEKAENTDKVLVQKMKEAKEAGATIEEIASVTRRTPEWVKQQLE